MEKHFMITISNDISCLHGVRFVTSFFENRSDVRLTLIYVGAPCSSGGPGAAWLSPAEDSDIEPISRKEAENAMATSKRLLCDKGFHAEHVMAKIIRRQFGTVNDIIREGREGRYDAVVLGARGYSLFQALYDESVSRNILEHDIPFPIWIARRPEEGRRNVLLCVDGSEASLRMADHVGCMLAGEEHKVTIFIVDTGEDLDVEEALVGARQTLLDGGLLEKQIGTKVVRAKRVVKIILDEAEKGRYAAVAVGRVGVHKAGLKGWLVGSRSMALLEQIEKAALWVSR